MTQKIRQSKKPILKLLLSAIESDGRSNTGKNLRSIRILTDKHDICDIQLSDLDPIPYVQVKDDEVWKIEVIKHILEEREEHPLDDEDTEWLEHLCCD